MYISPDGKLTFREPKRPVFPYKVKSLHIELICSKGRRDYGSQLLGEACELARRLGIGMVSLHAANGKLVDYYTGKGFEMNVMGDDEEGNRRLHSELSYDNGVEHGIYMSKKVHIS